MRVIVVIRNIKFERFVRVIVTSLKKVKKAIGIFWLFGLLG